MSLRPFCKSAAVLLLMLPGAALVPGPAGAQVQAQNPAGNPGNVAIAADALRTAAGGGLVRAFYEINDWKAVWSDAASRELDRSLADRARHGLDQLVFLDASATVDAAALETARTTAALGYASALARGASDDADRHDPYAVSLLATDLAGPLADAIAQGNVSNWLESLAPHDSDYQRLSREYLDVRQDIGSTVGLTIADGVLHVGDTDSRVPAIVDRLTGGQYLARQKTMAGASPDALNARPPAIYTEGIADAVRHLQRDYGIAEDGIIGPATLEVLNLRPGDRARALAVALERLRWLTRTPPPLRIDVNTAAAQLSYYRDGVVVDTRRAVVGKPRHGNTATALPDLPARRQSNLDNSEIDPEWRNGRGQPFVSAPKKHGAQKRLDRATIGSGQCAGSRQVRLRWSRNPGQDVKLLPI